MSEALFTETVPLIIEYETGREARAPRTITAAAKDDGVEIVVAVFEENAQYSD